MTGVTTQAKTRTHYDVLGVDRTADDAEIRRAWKTLVQVWHPDRFPDGDTRDKAQEQTQAINEAWSTLRHGDKRSQYDRRVEAEREARIASAAGRRRANGGFGSSPFRATGDDASAWGTTRSGEQSARTAPRVVVAGPPPTVIDHLQQFARDFQAAGKRFPRTTMAVASVWVAIFGYAVVQHVVFAPKLPQGVEASVSSAPDAPGARELHLQHLRDSEVLPDADTQLPSDSDLGLTPNATGAAPEARVVPVPGEPSAAGGGAAGEPTDGQAVPQEQPPTDDARPRRVLRIHPSNAR